MGMNYGEERYVRLFIRDTVGWRVGPWQARALLPLVLRKLDRVGLMDLGDDGVEALAIMVELPLDVVQIGLTHWLNRGTLKIVRGVLVMPNFLDAQEAKASDAQRARESRAKARDKALAEEKGLIVTKRDGDDTARDATDTQRDGSDTKQNGTVTPGNDQSLCAVPSRTEPSEPPVLSVPPADAGSNGVQKPMQSLPAWNISLNGPFWIEHYQQAATAALGRAWSFDKKQLHDLNDVIGVHCVDKTKIEQWIESVVTAFISATKGEPKFWMAHQPRGLGKWLNEGGGTAKKSNGVLYKNKVV